MWIASFLCEDDENFCECGMCKVKVKYKPNNYTYVMTKDEYLSSLEPEAKPEIELLSNLNDIKECPFCRGDSVLNEETLRQGYDEYMTTQKYCFVECCSCGARSRAMKKPCLSDFTNYTVQDFRDNPILRVKEEENHELLIKSIEADTISYWNKRKE